MVVHGTHDPVVPARHSELLAASANPETPGMDLLLSRDDHFLFATATPQKMAQWIVELCAASDFTGNQRANQERAGQGQASSAAVGVALRRQDRATYA